MKVVGALLGTMSGSMGGLTASRNRGGQYFRQRVVPTNPASTRQNAVRAYLASAVAAWTNTLTAAQRTAWATYAANTPRTDSLGNEIVLTGQQAYIGAYVPRMQAGAAVPTAAPTVFNRGEPVASITTSLGGAPNLIGLDLGNTSDVLALMDAASDDGDILIFLGPPISEAVNFYKGPYQLADVVPIAAAATTVNWSTDVTTLSDDVALVAGQSRPIRIIIAYDDGRTSESFALVCPVIADA